MKRGAPLRRTTALRSDPAKRAAFLKRGRGSLARKPLGRSAPTPPVKVPAAARREAVARSRGVCVCCLAGGIEPISDSALRRLLAAGIVRRAVQVHHVLPKAKWPHLAKLAANLVGVCVEHHANHESAYERIPRSALPAEVIALAEDEGLTWYIARTYPEPRP